MQHDKPLRGGGSPLGDCNRVAHKVYIKIANYVTCNIIPISDDIVLEIWVSKYINEYTRFECECGSGKVCVCVCEWECAFKLTTFMMSTLRAAADCKIVWINTNCSAIDEARGVRLLCGTVGWVSEMDEWVRRLSEWVCECGAPVHVYVALLLNYFRDCWRGGSGRRQWITVCACMHVYIYVYVCGVYFSSANKTSIAWYKLQITLNRLRLEARWSTLPQVLDVSMPRCLRSVCVVCSVPCGTFHAASARRQHAAGIHLPCLVCLVAARALLTQVLLIICHLRAWHMLQQQQQRTQ